MSTLSNQDQLRYVVEWFQEWSEMQRADFLEILAERCGSPSTVNGLSSLVDGLSCKEESNRPPSLFQCRVKLFHEWSQNWSQQEKDGLVVSIKNMDPKFAEKYDQREVELSDRKTFVITAGEDSDEEDEESENEMIQPEDLAGFGSLVDDEERYRPLHSHVEHYNRRAAESAAQSSETAPHFQPNLEERSSMEEEEPFIAGFKHELDEYDFARQAEVEIVSPRRKRHESGVKSPNDSVNRSKREDEDILASTEVSGDLVETISSRNHSLPQGEYAGHATPHPGDPSDRTMESETRRSEDYAEEEHTSISYEHPAAGGLDESGRKESADRGFFESEADTTEASLDEAEEEAYDYENFRAEYDQQIEDAKSSNMTFNYTDNGEPEETAKDAIKKIVEFDMPKNCTKEELTQFGVRALECLAFDYRNARNQSDVRRVLARTWTVVRIWICIYVCIAVPCWCQKGWCCCCFRCSMCFPEDRIFQAKHYYAQNSPGLLVDQPRKKSEVPEPIKYKPTLFELDAYENFESAIRNL